MANFQEGKSYNVIHSVLSAIKYFHSISGFPLDNSSLIDHLTEAFKRVTSHKTSKKLSLTVKDLKSTVIWLDSKQTLKDLRTKVIMLISFAAFLRFSECQNLRRSDIKLFSKYAMFFVEKSKTDTYRDGHWVCIARLKSELCPIRNLEEYLLRTSIEESSNEFIFRAIMCSKKKQILRQKDNPISYSTIRDEFKSMLKGINLNPSLYGLHSLRSGGASAAANLGVRDRLIKKHGRWKSEGVKDRYISEDLKNLLFVSRNLGL